MSEEAEGFKVPVLPVVASSTKPAESKPPKVPEEPRIEGTVNSATNTSPASVPKCPYNVPPWSAAPPPDVNYKFEVLKSGQIIEQVDELQRQAIWKFGRLCKPSNDLELAHPTISRFHAVLQYRPHVEKTADADNQDESADVEGDKQSPLSGWYIYDLDSTHGTFLNKQRIPSRVYIRMRVGHMLRLGASTRSYILQGPTEDEEPESELSITELREQRQQMLVAAAAEVQCKAEEAKERERNEGISWGMAEDADEETDLTHNPYAATNNEELFLDDPKRTLRGYFEREGLQLEYKCDEMSAGSFVCRVELPIDDAFGRPIVAEVVHKGRKKECVVQCALEACRILDRHGVLRQANQEPLKRKVKSHSDSDEDDFLDRTGDVERKKMRKTNTGMNTALTYEDLLKQEAELVEQLQKIEIEISKHQETRQRQKDAASRNDTDNDDLDSFMQNLQDDTSRLDKTEIRRLRMEEQRIKTEQQRVQRLIKIVKPLDLPFATGMAGVAPSMATTSKKQFPMIGKRNQFSKFKVVKMQPKSSNTTANTTLASDEEEEENDNEEEQSSETKPQDTKKHEKCEELEANGLQTDLRNSIETTGEPASAPKVYGPTVISLQLHESEMENVGSNAEEILENAQHLQTPTNTNDEQTDSESRKKRHKRPRQRHRRQEVDDNELDEHESSEKYAKWLPPANQTGDGYTELNEKYGY